VHYPVDKSKHKVAYSSLQNLLLLKRDDFSVTEYSFLGFQLKNVYPSFTAALVPVSPLSLRFLLYCNSEPADIFHRNRKTTKTLNISQSRIYISFSK